MLLPCLVILKTMLEFFIDQSDLLSSSNNFVLDSNLIIVIVSLVTANIMNIVRLLSNYKGMSVL